MIAVLIGLAACAFALLAVGSAVKLGRELRALVREGEDPLHADDWLGEGNRR